MSETDRIELSERQRERFDRIKAECSNDHLPEPTDEVMFDSLLDTWDAVGDGLYSDSSPTPLERVRALIDRCLSTARDHSDNAENRTEEP